MANSSGSEGGPFWRVLAAHSNLGEEEPPMANTPDEGWWAPALTVHWTHPRTGAAQVTQVPNVPPELFRTPEAARERAQFHGRNWVDRHAWRPVA